MSTNVTLSSSISANLHSLQATQKLMNQTEYRLTTGKKVNSALDDPINYFTASDHTQKASDLQVLKDSMGEGIETINAASEGIDAISDLIDSAKSLAQSAQATTVAADRSSYMTQYNAILTEITNLASDSGYSGTNLLTGGTTTVNFNTAGTSKITITGITATATGLSLITQTETAGDWASADITAAITALDSAKGTLRTGAKTLSTQLNTVTARQDFTANMINTLTEGAGNLVNADTTEEGVKLTTLQTQQSLAVQSLSIANSAGQAVLSLFQ